MPILNEKGTDFFFERKTSLAEAAASITALVTSRLPGYLKYPEKEAAALAVRNIQVLAPARKGECGVFDCTRYLADPFWARLKDKSVFDKVRVDCGTLTWPGDIDIAHEEVWTGAVRT